MQLTGCILSCMKQLIRPRTDPRVVAELATIFERRIASPPAPGSVRPVIRPAVPADRPAVEAMVTRCGPETLRRRFHAPPPDLRPERVADLLDGRGGGEHLVAVADGAVVGMASLHPVRDGDAEFAVVVEDAWQHTGLGHRLTGHVLRLAAERGVRTVVADVLREPAFLVERLRRICAETAVTMDGPVATVRIPVGCVGATAGAARSA